jgi:signal transduction histidine kinase
MPKANLAGVIILRPRCDEREKAGAADHSERASGGHGADDRRLRPRAQQSADRHSRQFRTAAGIGVSEAARKPIAALRQEARRAADIVQNLQYFARPPAPGRTQVDLNELVQRTVQMQAYPLRKSNITVDFLPDPAIPAIVADPNQLMQVFLNLLLNAEQAIREGREKGTIRIRIGRKPDSVWIVFQDDGPGIAPENLEHIFDPFFTTKRPGRGTGLGLSICKTVLREHGGNIEAATAPDGGAVFTITLPVAAAGAGAAAK